MGVNLGSSWESDTLSLPIGEKRKMAWLREWLVIVLLALSVRAQDAPGGDSADAAGDAAEGKSGGEGDEEAWQYVEFLKSEINEKVEVILQKTLYEAREKKGFTVLEET